MDQKAEFSHFSVAFWSTFFVYVRCYVGKKVRVVFNINVILSLNFEISCRLSTHLLSTVAVNERPNPYPVLDDIGT